MKARSWKKTLAVCASAAVVLGGMSVQPISQLPGTAASADSGVAYVVRSWNSETKKVEEKTEYCSVYSTLSGAEDTNLQKRLVCYKRRKLFWFE